MCYMGSVTFSADQFFKEVQQFIRFCFTNRHKVECCDPSTVARLTRFPATVPAACTVVVS